MSSPRFNGVTSGTTRVSNAAIDQYALVKASTTAGRVETLGAAELPVKAIGVALLGTTGAGQKLRVQELNGVQSPMLSDGTTEIFPGDLVEPSPTVAGRVRAGTLNPIGSAMSHAAMVLNAHVEVV